MSATSLFLIGPTGAGKTTIGRHLARRRGLEFLDSDQVIVERTGADIPWIFDREGEEGFRRREEQVIDELTARQGIVLATGGGAILREQNRQHLASRGTVIYLKVSIEDQLERTSRDKNRPLLQSDNPREVLEKMMHERAPLYESIADLRVATGKGNARELVTRIMTLLGES